MSSPNPDSSDFSYPTGFYLSLIPTILIGIPLILTLFFKWANLEYIGLLVFLYGFSTLFTVPVALFYMVGHLISKHGPKSTQRAHTKITQSKGAKYYKAIITLLLLIVGVLLGVLGWSIFIGLNHLFGILNYQLT